MQEKDHVPKVIRQALRVVAAAEGKPIMRRSRIEVNVEFREVEWNDWPIEGLNDQQFNLLAHFWANNGRLTSFEELERTHWMSRTELMAQVNQLRRKMEPNPSFPVHFVREENVGIHFINEFFFD